MLLLHCPGCGPRNISEFRFGGAVRPRPADPAAMSDEAWTDYLYFRDNPCGRQEEWWYHAFGCGLWFVAVRDTSSNHVERTYDRSSPAGGRADADAR
jgi:heterotetrameric sarcosine oxidase delta subunit